MEYESRQRVNFGLDFDEAGEAYDIFEANLIWRVAEHIKLAQIELKIAGIVRLDRPTEAGWIAANSHARMSLQHFRTALDLAEDSHLEDVAHALMDKAGAWVRRAFGCPLVVKNAQIQIDCPVKLGHTRIGLSAGIRVKKRRCQLCGLDLSECPHLPGIAYWVPGGYSELGWCRICGGVDCTHSPELEYRIPLIAVVTEAEIDEISFVAKPAMKVTRITGYSQPVAQLEAILGYDLPDGSVLSCNSCLLPCEGLIRPELEALQGAASSGCS